MNIPTRNAIQEQLDNIVKDVIAPGEDISYLNMEHYYTNGRFTDKAIISVLSKIMEHFVYTDRISLRLFNTRAMQAINYIFNEIYEGAAAHRVMVTLRDMLDIAYHPKIVKGREKIREEETVESINDLYASLKEVLEETQEVNTISSLYASKTLNDTQVNQCFGARGFVADMDSSVFNKPISECYVTGLSDLYSFSIDSRSAVTALWFSSTSIQDAEDFSKMVQLQAMVVDDFSVEDCGTTEGHELTVEESDRETLIGAYYKRRPEDSWTPYHGESELIGEKIIVRTAMTCKCEKYNRVCKRCVGEITKQIMPNYNIGYWAVCQITEPNNQGLLSTKHRIASASDGDVVYSSTEARIFRADDEKVFFNKEHRYEDNIMYIPIASIPGLNAITHTNVSTIPVSEISNITDIQLIDGKGNLTDLHVAYKGRNAIMSRHLLEYLIKNGYTITDNDMIAIDMRNWKKSRQLFYVPKKTFDFRKYSAGLAKMIENSGRSNDGTKITNGREMLNALYRYINSKMSVSFSAINVFVYSLTAEDPDSGNFRPIKDPEHPLPKFGHIRYRRSFTSMMNSGTTKYSLNPVFRIDRKKTSHPLDVLFAPNEVLGLKHEDNTT